MYFMYSEATVIEAKKVATHPATTPATTLQPPRCTPSARHLAAIRASARRTSAPLPSAPLQVVTDVRMAG
eukprot:scaffold107605_cov57-Phaeocystis_antarctica.AAC.2